MIASPVVKTKDPDEDLDFTWDFSALLGEDEVIASYDFHDTPAAIELHDDAASDTAVTAWVSPGGVVGTRYDVACSIVTDSTPPRTFDRTIRFVMVAK
jgi:hypothetical protein